MYPVELAARFSVSVLFSLDYNVFLVIDFEANDKQGFPDSDILNHPISRFS